MHNHKYVHVHVYYVYTHVVGVTCVWQWLSGEFESSLVINDFLNPPLPVLKAGHPFILPELC